MKKIILSESQAKKLVGNLKEQYDDERYTEEVTCDINLYTSQGTKYKGGEIADYDMHVKIPITFRIGLEYRKYGITGASVYDIKGPNELEFQIEYYKPGQSWEDYNKTGIDSPTIQETVRLPLDWENNLNQEKSDDHTFIGVEDTMNVDVINDKQGNLIISTITVYAAGF